MYNCGDCFSRTIVRISTANAPASCSNHDQPLTSRFFRRGYSSWDDYPNTLFTENGFMAGTASVTSSGLGAKRKRDSAPKFYAVKAGKVPGVYTTWDEAKRQTDGVSGSICMQAHCMSGLN